MPGRTRRYIHLDKGHVSIECPRLMTDGELADRLAAFVEEVRARPPREPPMPPEPRIESLLPAKCKTVKRR
jgi:hypothetical protein